MPRRRPTDSVVFVAGARGSGKSSWLKQYVRGFGRALVWDPMNEYGPALGVDPVRSLAELADRHRVEPVLVYAPPVVSVPVFDFVCKLAWSRGPGLFVVDELATVTGPAKALGWWGRLIREGRHRSIAIAAAAQRPAEIDKTIIGNATRLVVFRLGRLRDRQLMAEEIDAERDQIDSLAPLEFLDADRLAQRIARSRIVFAR